MLNASPSNSKCFSNFSHALISRRWISNGYTHQIQIKPILFDQVIDYLDHLLRGCNSFRQLKQIHTQFVLWGGSSTAFLASRLVSVYGRFELLNEARKVFDTVPIDCLSNTILWNSMLRANVTNGECRETLRVYIQMRNFGAVADGFSLPLVVRASTVMGHRRSCELVHCHVFVMGLQENLHISNELLAVYGKLGQMGVARQVFDRMIVRNYISWNTLVSGFAFNSDCVGALEVFKRMELEGWEPNLVTWTSLLSSHARCGHHWETVRLYNVMRSRGISAPAESLAVVVSMCNNSELFDKVTEIHGYVVRAGFENYSFVKNALVCLYGRHGVLEAAQDLFLEINSKNLVSWNALISSYAQVGLCDEAFSAFLRLERSEGCVRPNVISWSAVISGFASKGRSENSLELFRKMQLAGVRANAITISTVLSICADLSALVLGKEIHARVIRALMDRSPLVGNGLINMYAKCGSLKEGHIAFKNIEGKDLFSWNTMIKGYGMQGLGEKALETFDQMIIHGFRPDGVTFVSLLSACSHAGLISEGCKLFNRMKTELGIEPKMEHYASMVDLLGRAGFLQEASDVVKKMPMEPNAYVWGALLNSCRMHKNINCLNDESVLKILGVSSATGNYMLLSNIYAESGRWDESAKVRVSARVRDLKKIPGQSWIELKKTVHMFTSGDGVQSGKEDVHRMLKILSFQMEMEGYVAHENIFWLQSTDDEVSYYQEGLATSKLNEKARAFYPALLHKKGDPNVDVKKVKPPTGIPKSILKPNEAAFEKEIEGMPSIRNVGDLPPELHCPLCTEVMKDAVLTSKCYFKRFCDKCISDHIYLKQYVPVGLQMCFLVISCPI